MKRKYLIVILFILLTSLEMGIFTEVLWHGWGGFGDISLEYTEAGENGIAFLIFCIPVSVIVIFAIRMALCIKKGNDRKELFWDCFWAFLGIGIVTVMFFVMPFFLSGFPTFGLGRLIAAFFIDFFQWMDYPIP